MLALRGRGGEEEVSPHHTNDSVDSGLSPTVKEAFLLHKPSCLSLSFLPKACIFLYPIFISPTPPTWGSILP